MLTFDKRGIIFSAKLNYSVIHRYNSIFNIVIYAAMTNIYNLK